MISIIDEQTTTTTKPVNELIRLHFIYAYVCVYLHILVYMNKSMNFKGNGRNDGRVWKMEREGQKDN